MENDNSNSLFSRSASLEDLKELILSLEKNNVKYILIGGYAMFAHGYQRATIDIDILVPSDVDNGRNVIKALMILPDKAASAIDPLWFSSEDDVEFGAAIRVSDEITVDIMFNANGETFETLENLTETIYLDDVPVRTLTIEGLIKTKQTVREKDAMDRNILERALLLTQSSTFNSQAKKNKP